MASYDSGDAVRLSVTFTVAAVATDPTTVTCKTLSPLGVQTNYVYLTDAALVKDSTGNYHLDIAPAVAGTWQFRWIGTGACVVAEEKSFDVRASVFA